MSEFQKIIITAGLSYASAVCTVLIGYYLNTASANRKARRTHKTQLRLFRTSFRVTNQADHIKQLSKWWVHAIDDCGWLCRRRVEDLISQFKQLKFPVRDWDTNVESEYTPDKTARYQQKLDDVNSQATAILDRIIKRL